jgi:hypothetical protein
MYDSPSWQSNGRFCTSHSTEQSKFGQFSYPVYRQSSSGGKVSSPVSEQVSQVRQYSFGSKRRKQVAASRNTILTNKTPNASANGKIGTPQIVPAEPEEEKITGTH